MKKSFLVIGLGRFGSSVATTLAKSNCDVLAMDISEEAVANVAKNVLHSVIADSTKISVLEKLGAKNVDHAVVAIGNNLEASILTIVNLKTIGVKKITVRADNEKYKEIFMLIGATDVVVPEEDFGEAIGNQIKSDSILDYYLITDNHAMAQINVSRDFEGKNLKELDLRNEFSINIVGIIRDEKFFIPLWSDTLNKGDVVVVAGKDKDINKIDVFLNNYK